MIPRSMDVFLRERLPASAWQNRLTRAGGLCFLEFGPTDVDQLARLGIAADALGPRLVVCLWDEEAPREIGGYLVVDNLAKGQPSMGGIRLLPDVTPAAIHNLARGMTLKNAAADLPFGGGKSGIVAEAGLAPEARAEVVRGFARLLFRYRDVYVPGPDVGTNDADMKTIAVENGIDHVVSKPADMGGNRIDQLGAAAGGVVIALEALLEEMPRLWALPQFARLNVPPPEEVTVLIQGFGAVGAHAARILRERMPGARVVGVSDAAGCLYDPAGLPVDELFAAWHAHGLVTRPWFLERAARGDLPPGRKFSSSPDDLLREDAFCLIPAAPVAHYLDTDPATRPSTTVDRMGGWRLSVEGANTYSPDLARRALRARMERAVYRQRGVLIATDYLVNSGGVIFAAQERLIKTPQHLRLPAEALGNPAAVDRWLAEHAADFAALAERRRQAAERFREDVIRRNMRELVDLLLADADMLPAEAAERISIGRIASGERDRRAADVAVPLPTVPGEASVREAAARLVEAASPILAVVTAAGALAGVVTEWDITRATAQGSPDDQPVQTIMSRDVVAAAPGDSLADVIRQMEYHQISAVPVVEAGEVRGMVSADLLARQSLLRLLQVR